MTLGVNEVGEKKKKIHMKARRSGLAHELAAFEKLCEILKPLSPSQRQRVMALVADDLEISSL